MRWTLITLAFTLGLSADQAEALISAKPGIGARINLAEFGRNDSNGTAEWDEPREFREIIAEFKDPIDPRSVRIEYWSSVWPPPEGRGGWTLAESTWNGRWRKAQTTHLQAGKTHRWTFEPLSEAENPNQKNRPAWKPEFRVALKIRLSGVPAPVRFEVLGESRWAVQDFYVDSGVNFAVAIYNGRLISRRGNRLTVGFAEHTDGSFDRTVLSFTSGRWRFGVSVDDIVKHRGLLMRESDFFVSAHPDLTRARWVADGRVRPGTDIRTRVMQRAETSLDRAAAEIPAPAKTANNGRHPVRYVPLGLPVVREKFGLEHNGNLFMSKHGSKLFEDELTGTRWEGDKLRLRIGSGESPDFRERENAATQSPAESGAPVWITRWTQGAMEYEETAFSTVAGASVDAPWTLRGDEPAVALIRLRVLNAGSAAGVSTVHFEVTPDEQLTLRSGAVWGTQDRLRYLLQPSAGTLSAGSTSAIRWTTPLVAGGSSQILITLPFRTMTTEAEVRKLDFEMERQKIENFWSVELARGMTITVPDRALQNLFRSSLHHMLISVQRDVQTGLDMLPCATLDYNMYLNETNMQVRLLDMRGLGDYAEKFLDPALRFQGSKAFPGRFQTSEGIFHGIRVTEKHDYTNWGYNLNHGWTMWTLAEHYLFTRDLAWLRRVRSNLVRAGEWIIRERQATKTTPGTPEYGLLPAGQLEDNEEWQHWFAVNAYAYRGLSAAARVLREIDPANAERFAAEALSYRADIRRAVEHAMSLAPAAQLRDGSWVPVIPPRTALHGRDQGWIRNVLYGAHVLIDCGVYAPDEAVADAILADLEDNLFLSSDALGIAEQDWLSRGGITLQPNLVNTFVTYQARNEVPLALRAFFHTFAASYFADIHAFTEWVPSFGRSGGPYFKTSDEAGFLTWLRLLLLREDGDSLRLLSAAPRAWFRPGERIRVTGAATFFGPVSFSIESPDERTVTAEILLPTASDARNVILRLPHATGRRLIRAVVNGEAIPVQESTLTLPWKPGPMRVEAYYE